MDYEIIFYHSGKTAEIEKTINFKFLEIEMQMTKSFAATSPSELAQELKTSLERCDVVVIVGGLDGGHQSTDNVLSTVLSSSKGKMKSNKLLDDNENAAYTISCKEQNIIVFPDETSVISNMIDAKIKSLLMKQYNLKQKEDQKPSINDIAKELDHQLSGVSRVRTTNNISQKLEEKSLKSLRVLKIATITLTGLAIIQLIAAAYIYFVNYIV